MKVLGIVRAPDPILNQVCEEADLNKVETHELIHSMVQTMLDKRGQGLAAPQVGVALRIFVMRYGSSVLLATNPKITRRGRETSRAIEACLSIPGKQIMMTRNKIIDLEYTDIGGTKQKLKLRGVDARCAQHEMDHLNGILITT